MVDIGIDLVRQALTQALILAAPILLAGLAIGLVVSIFQTVTQVQEQTLSFVPKIGGMILVAIAIIPWIINVMLDYTTAMFTGQF